MSQVSVLISSFDGYADCWGPVCHGFTKYWPDCPYPIYLMTNHLDYPHPRVEVMKVAGGRDWSGRMLTALDRIQTPYVLYFQEDYWIRQPVDTAKIVAYADHMERHGLNYLRLLSKPTPDHDFTHDARLGVLATNAPYRTSVQISFWRKEVLRDLIRPGESVWHFEILGSKRSRKYGDTFLSIKQHNGDDYCHGMYYVCTAINLGKWAWIAKDYARQEGLAVDFSKLPTDTWWDVYKRESRVGEFVNRWAYRAGLACHNPSLALQKLRNRLSRSANTAADEDALNMNALAVGRR